jgi:hypothetical protein
MARPTEYTNKLVKKALIYFDTYKDHGDVIPSVEGMAYFLGISRDTVYEWAKEHKEFSDIVALLRTAKSRTLQNGGLDNTLNASVAKLLLGHEGYRESQDITSDGQKIESNTVILQRYNEGSPESK